MVFYDRERTCTNPIPQGLGYGCVGNFTETEDCENQPCSGTRTLLEIKSNLCIFSKLTLYKYFFYQKGEPIGS